MDSKCSDLRSVMRILGIAPLFLALALIPESGVSQASQNQHCSECKNVVRADNDKFLIWIINKGVKNYTECPGTLIRFQVKNGSYCLLNNLEITKTLMTCIKAGNCTDLLPSKSKQDFSKGAIKNPSTTIRSTTTTPHVTSQKTTAQWIPNIINSTEATEREISTSSKSPVTHDPKNGSINAHQGDTLPKASEPAPEEESDGKMKNMRTTIMALIFIILVMVGVGTGVYCQKKKPLCLATSVKYRAASSRDSLVMEMTP